MVTPVLPTRGAHPDVLPFSENEGDLDPTPLTRHRASEFVRHGVITLEPDRPLRSAIKAMVLHRVPGTVLLNERDPVRVIEEADAIRALRSLEGAHSEPRRGGSPAPGDDRPDDSLLDAAIETVRRGVTHALVRSPGSRRGVYGTLFAIDIARATGVTTSRPGSGPPRGYPAWSDRRAGPSACRWAT
jgi:CBS domain-containing protein